jgi:hypothetical protein
MVISVYLKCVVYCCMNSLLSFHHKTIQSYSLVFVCMVMFVFMHTDQNKVTNLLTHYSTPLNKFSNIISYSVWNQHTTHNTQHTTRNT